MHLLFMMCLLKLMGTTMPAWLENTLKVGGVISVLLEVAWLFVGSVWLFTDGSCRDGKT